jgi:hypothetical protein
MKGEATVHVVIASEIGSDTYNPNYDSSTLLIFETLPWDKSIARSSD